MQGIIDLIRTYFNVGIIKEILALSFKRRAVYYYFLGVFGADRNNNRHDNLYCASV